MNVRDPVRQWVEKRLAGASLDALAGDASTRTFYRVRPISGDSRILMDYGTRFCGDSDDQKLTAVFRAAGLPVPEVISKYAGLLEFKIDAETRRDAR